MWPWHVKMATRNSKLVEVVTVLDVDDEKQFTHSLGFSKLYWCDLWLVKMPTQNLLRLLLLLIIMVRNVLRTVWRRFGSWSWVINSNFCSDIEQKDWSQDFCLLPSLAFALPRVLTCSSNNTEILLRVCISVNVLHIKDISEKILYIKERNLTKKIRGSKGQGKCWTRSVV